MDELLNEARKRVEKKYGTDFTNKVSNELCLLLGKNTMQFAGFREGGRPQPPQVNQLIVECAAAPPPVPAPTPTLAPKMLERLAETAKDLAPVVEKVAPHLERFMQRREMEEARDFVLNAVQSVNVFLASVDRSAASAEQASLPSGNRSPVCWLNQTMQTGADAAYLAEVAADPAVERFDLPRKIKREISITGQSIGAPQFRNSQGCNGAKIKVAVIDSEIHLHHPCLANRLIQMENYTNEPWGNPDYHGTAIAGIIASADPAYTGIAPGVVLYNYKVMATDDNLNGNDFAGTLALQKALEDGMHIANCSWGTGLVGTRPSREARACNTAWQRGLVIVKSAGNAGPGPVTLTIPADADGVIVVGATDRNGTAIQDYSSRGPLFTNHERPHLVAPGGFTGDEICTAHTNGLFQSAGFGTSYAAPHVTGALALILEKHPAFSPDELRNYLLRQCKQLNGYSGNDQGLGLLSL